jgi:hypothetical protein
MAEGQWKEEYEAAGDAEFAKFSALSVGELRRRVERREFGQQYSFWTAIAAKRDVAAFGWLLFDFINSSEDYLQRYHAARALLALLKVTIYEPGDLTIAHRHPEKALADVAARLVQAIGPRAS